MFEEVPVDTVLFSFICVVLVSKSVLNAVFSEKVGFLLSRVVCKLVISVIPKTTSPVLLATLKTFAVLSIFTHPVVVLIARSDAFQSVIPSNSVAPPTVTRQENPVVVSLVMSGVFVFAFHPPCRITPPTTASICSFKLTPMFADNGVFVLEVVRLLTMSSILLFRSNAVCVSVEIGLFISLVLFTFSNPKSAFVTL